MENIRKEVDVQRDLTVFTIVGKVTARDIVEAIEDFYGSQVTMKVLWDLSKCDASGISSSEVRSIAQTPREGSKLRYEGKTAIVAPDDVTFGLSRMYGILMEGEEHSFQTRSFRSTESAYKWLLENE